MAATFDKFMSTHLDSPDPSLPDLPWSETWSGARRCFQHSIKSPLDIFRGYFIHARLVVPTCLSRLLSAPTRRVVPALSAWKRYVHEHFSELPALAYMYLDFETFSGYPRMNNRAETDDPVKWLVTDVEDEHDADWWYRQFLATYAVDRAPLLVSLEQFTVSRWMWVTPGATGVSKLLLRDKAVRTKFGAAVSLSNEELLKLVSDAQVDNEIRMFLKPDEKGYKRRLIANLDLGAYIIAAYVRYLITSTMGDPPYFMKATTSLDDDVQVIELLRGGNRAVPLDESAYDYHLSSKMWQGFLKFVDRVFPSATAFRRMFEASYIVKDGMRMPWRKGMPSGLALTSILNTWTNYIKQQPIESPIHYALGDDVLVFNNSVSLSELSAYYARFGAEVNVKKNFVSNTLAEFLKFLYYRSGRVGYPARIWSSLIWSAKFTDNTPVARLNELASLFKEFYDRALLDVDERVMSSDLSRSVSTKLIGFNASVVKQWLHAPTAMGGFGLFPWNRVRFKFITKSTRDEYQYALIRLPPVSTVIKTEWSMQSYRVTQLSYRLGRPAVLPPIESMKDWEARLNGEDVDIPQSKRDLAFSTIPLPRLPLVSDVVMSKFAASLDFYCWPNLFGPRDRVETRLFNAGLALANAVRLTMEERGMSYWL